MNLSRISRWIAAAGVGIVGCIAGSWSTGPSQSPASADIERSSVAQRKQIVVQTVAPAQLNHLASRLHDLERQLSELPDRDDQDGDGAATDPAEYAALLAQERHASQAEDRQNFAAAIELHDAQPGGSSWSARAGASLEDGIADVIRRTDDVASLEGVDCRSDSCLAVLRFPSYRQAMSNFARYVTSSYEQNCATSSVVAPPEDPTQPYNVKVLFTGCQDR